jgi:diacylglycerol kinase (ATP)
MATTVSVKEYRVDRLAQFVAGRGEYVMRRVALIYNPMSGQLPEQRAGVIADVAAVFLGAGIEVKALATEGPDSAGRLALEATADGYDTILACGGDGTVHEALQTMVGGSAVLGVIPMGTANALAVDLGLPANPVRAAKRLLKATPVRVSVGNVFFTGDDGESRSRYFVVAAGIGVDGLFFSRLDSRMKRRFGYAAYFIEAMRLAFTHTFPMFAAEFIETATGAPRVEEVSQVLAVRISNFGGMVNNLVPGAALGNGNLHAMAFKTRSRWEYLRFMVAVWFQRHKYAGAIEVVDCSQVECRDLDSSTERLHVEADGEWLGTLPVRIEVVPQALTLLIPPKPLRRR